MITTLNTPRYGLRLAWGYVALAPNRAAQGIYFNLELGTWNLELRVMYPHGLTSSLYPSRHHIIHRHVKHAVHRFNQHFRWKFKSAGSHGINGHGK